MHIEKKEIKLELHPKLVFMQQLSDRYFDRMMIDYGMTNRKEFIAGHEFYIQYSNDYLKCNIWTDCDSYSIQFVDLYFISNSKDERIDLWNFKESIDIKKLYELSSKESAPLTTTFVEEYLKKEGEYEELHKPLDDYYTRIGAERFEMNFKLHTDLFRKHPELFRQDFENREKIKSNRKSKITVRVNGKKDLQLSDNLTFKEKIKRLLGI